MIYRSKNWVCAEDITAMDARLCVATMDGQIGRNVPISFRTQPGTATGTWTSKLNDILFQIRYHSLMHFQVIHNYYVNS